MNINQVLKRKGFVNGADYRLVEEKGAVILHWLSDRPQPSAEDLAAGWAELVAKAHRPKRKAAYIARLGEDGTFENTVGDVLDAVIRQTEINRRAVGAASDPEFAAKLAIIGAIKAEFPAKEGE